MNIVSVNVMDSASLLKEIQNGQSVIYGTGYAAENFFKALQIRGVAERVKYFAQTDTGNGKRIFNNLKIISVDELAEMKGMFVCLAVHEAIRDEIIKIFQERGITNFVWVHPNIYELAFGTPIKYDTDIKIRDIVCRQENENYYFAVRYLAIEEYFKKNDYGYKVYLQAMRLQCEEKTAYRRLEKFCELIGNWAGVGYQTNSPILIDENYRLIDGTHRICLALYFKQEIIKGIIFPASEHFYEIAKETDFLPESMLVDAGLEREQIDVIKKTQIRIRERVMSNNNSDML